VAGMPMPIISFSESYTDEACWYFNKKLGKSCCALNSANGLAPGEGYLNGEGKRKR
jgi:hypothetical protein